jgi:hypothetical protein
MKRPKLTYNDLATLKKKNYIYIFLHIHTGGKWEIQISDLYFMNVIFGQLNYPLNNNNNNNNLHKTT